jgi:acetyl-CoA C-acetyltransferase
MAVRCGVVGIGQTKYDAKRIDVSMPGLVREAALRALEDADLSFADIDAVVIGKAPDMFEGVMLPENYLADAVGATGKPLLRVHTAGSVGGSTAVVAMSLIQAGIHDRVLTLSWEKQSESNAMWGLTLAPPFSVAVVAGAGGYFAPLIRSYIQRSGAPSRTARTHSRIPMHICASRGSTSTRSRIRRCSGIRSATSRAVRPPTERAPWWWRARSSP